MLTMCGESVGMRIMLLALAVSTLAASAADAAPNTRNYSVTTFNKIRLEGPYKVNLVTDVSPFARASGSQAALDGVAVEVQGRTLIVRSNRSSWGGYPGTQSGPVEISVGTHDLSAAFLNGSGSLSIDKIRGLTFELWVQGSGAATVARVDVDQLKVGMAGTATITLAGKAPKLTATVRGSSVFDGSALTAKDIVVGAQGPAIVKVNAVSSAKINATGTSTVEVTGSPACIVNAAGSVSVMGCN
jgi:hypothetical protein